MHSFVRRENQFKRLDVLKIKKSFLKAILYPFHCEQVIKIKIIIFVLIFILFFILQIINNSSFIKDRYSLISTGLAMHESKYSQGWLVGKSLKKYLAYSAGAVEYTDCTSAER